MVVLFADLLVTPLLYRCNLVRTPQLRTRNRCARIAARLQHLLYVSTAQRVLLPDRMASTLRSLRSGSALVGIVDSEEGRTHMMREHRILIVWPSLIAAGLLAAACTDQPKVSMAPNRPAFWVVPPPAQCPTGKWTGGGRIDPPSNPDTPDEAVHPEYFAVVLPSVTGKFTFGFNVFLGQDADGNCIVNKGEIEVNGHAQKIAWHVAIHDGVDAYDGRPVHATVFSDAHPGGFCLVVGIPDDYMTARENGKGSTEPFELAQFEVCDNDRGKPQKGKPGPDAMRWRSEHHGDTHLIYLTGGNVVEHGS